MPRAKKSTKKVTAAMTEMTAKKSATQPQPKKTTKKLLFLLGLAAVVLVWLFLRSRPGIFLAATVNGKPILKSELNKRLTDRFGEQMLEALISEQLIINAAQKQGVVVTPEEVQAKISEIEASLKGSVSLAESLKIQGITRGEFEKQISIQLSIDKMFSNQASVSAEQIDEFIELQGAQLTATTPAEQKIEAGNQLRQNQISQLFIEWFNQVKSEASVSKYLNPN